jgi:hypothetical protein
MIATKAEAEKDLRDTDKDLARIHLVIENMELFIRDSDGENRDFLKADLFRWNGLRDQANRLRDAILKHLATLEQKT